MRVFRFISDRLRQGFGGRSSPDKTAIMISNPHIINLLQPALFAAPSAPPRKLGVFGSS
jgi:hypothetical protein